MSLTASETGTRSAPIDEGVYLATAYQIVDLGTHTDPKFGKRANKVSITWELADCRMDVERDGQTLNLPRVISRKYTLSLHEKATLRKDLEAWRGRKFTPEELKAFDLRKLVGATCQLQIVHENRRDGGGIYASIAAIMAVPKGTPRAGKTENQPVVFTLDEVDATHPEIPNEIPEWLREIIKASEEWKDMAEGHDPDDKAESQALANETAKPPADEDNLPF